MKQPKTADKSRFSNLCALAIFTVIIFASNSAYAFTTLIEYDGIEGGYDDPADMHDNATLLDSFHWSINAAAAAGKGGSGAGSQVVFDDFHTVNTLDQSYPTLFSKLVTGKSIQKATVRLLAEDQFQSNKPLEFLKIEFDDVLLTSLILNGSNNAEAVSVTTEFNYRVVKITHTARDELGGAGKKTMATFDLVKQTGQAAQVANLFAAGLAGTTPAVVPLPAALWFFTAGLIGIARFRCRA